MLHEDEIPVDEAAVTSLLRIQCPEWASMSLSRAGAGTDNIMYRLGEDLLVRLPRTPDKARSLRKERTWLPRLGPLLTCRTPEPVYAGTPAPEFPLPWSIYRWIDGTEVGSHTVQDWATFGTELAMFVQELHSIDLMGATRADELSWYRGGNLKDCEEDISAYFADCRATTDDDLDVEALERLWRAAIELPESSSPHVWLHGDLRPANLLAAKGRLHAVIDFGGLSVGLPAAEHAPVWDFPDPARHAYWNAMNLDDLTWSQARAWAIAVGVAGMSYYRNTWPTFAAECRTRLETILTDAANTLTPGVSGNHSSRRTTPEPFEPGQVISRRYLRGSRVTWVQPMRVISDDETGLLLWHPVGSDIARLVDADGNTPHDIAVDRMRDPKLTLQIWTDYDILVLMRPDVAHAVWWFFQEGVFAGWYVNLEAPYVRRPDSVDTTDHVLDIVATPQRQWEWKDADEFDEHIGNPIYFDADTAETIRTEGHRLTKLIEAGEFPFDGTHTGFRPDPDWPTLRLTGTLDLS